MDSRPRYLWAALNEIPPRRTGLIVVFYLTCRFARRKPIQPNRLDDETRFTARQILLGAEEGNVMVAEHEAAIVGLLVARPDPALQVMHMIDLRVDYDHRRQGVGMALIYLLMMTLKGKDIRAISTVTQTNNFPACQLLRKCGFELTGFDTHRRSNHDLVKEQVSLLWYAAFD
jgi:ribosomal protein S18 acetylase RimI-like enzyme